MWFFQWTERNHLLQLENYQQCFTFIIVNPKIGASSMTRDNTLPIFTVRIPKSAKVQWTYSSYSDKKRWVYKYNYVCWSLSLYVLSSKVNFILWCTLLKNCMLQILQPFYGRHSLSWAVGGNPIHVSYGCDNSVWYNTAHRVATLISVPATKQTCLHTTHKRIQHT